MAQTAQINIRVDEKQAQGSVDNLNKSIKQTETTTTSLRAQLRQVTQELQGLEPGSARFSELSQRAGQLRDTIQDTNAVIKATAGNLTENLAKGLSGVAQIGVNGFQGIMGAAAMFGVESENLQKTMVALQGAMALTSSLEFFGGLGDKITEIKAGFQGLGQALGIIKTQQAAAAVSSTALAAGEVAAGVAAGAATPPTLALGAAMTALPIVAIIAGIAIMTALIYNYVTASTKAEKEEARRVKIQEEQIKLNSSAAQKMTDEIGQFGALIGMLKQTNATSKERSSLITEINAKYGTTLKNLKDEKAFQDQLNNSLVNFIALQKARFTQEASETRLKALFSEDEVNQNLLDSKKKQFEVEKARSLRGEGDAKKLEFLQGQVNGFQGILDRNAQKQKDIAKESLDAYQKEKQALGDLGIQPGSGGAGGSGGGNYGGALDVQNDKLEKRGKLLDEINERLQREKSATEQLKELNNDREIQITESDATIVTLRNKHEQAVSKIDLEYDKFKTSLEQNATQREKEKLEERFVNGTMSEKEYTDALKKITDNGYNNLLQVEKDLIDRKDDLRIAEKEKLKDDLLERTSDNLASADLIYYQLGQSKVQFDKQMSLKEIEMSDKTEEEKKRLRLKTLKYYEEVEIQQVNNISEKELDILYEKYQDDLKLAEENGESKSKIEAQYQSDKVNMEQTAALKIKDIQQAANENTKDMFSNTLTGMADELDKWGSKVMEIADAINALMAQQTQNQINDVNSKYQTESDRLQSLYDQKLLSEEEFNAQTKAMNQQKEQEEMALKRKQFNRDKAFNIANAIMTGAQAVLNGLATQPLVPVGIIMAAMAGALTGIQVATISKQQFKAARGGIVPGGGSGSIDSVPSLLAPGEAVINSNSAAMFPNTLSMINQAGGGISLAPEMAAQGSSGSGTIFTDNKNNQPVRAYVVETEITNSQNRVNRIQRSVEF